MSDNDMWDSLYESGDFAHWEPVYASPELSAFVAAGFVEENAKVLDVGCGGGLDSIFLAQYKFEVIGIDFSQTALKVARKRAKKARVKVQWCLGSVLGLPIESGAIDFINDRGVFHVIEDSDRERYGSEVFRVLNVGGRVLIRGASAEVERERFNPVTEEAIDKYFPVSKFKRGPVVSIPLFSSEGALPSKIVVLQKKGAEL